MTEVYDRYRRRVDAFERNVAAVGPDQWSNQSPCAEWTARDVVGHIIDMHGVMLRSLDRQLSPAPKLDEDPLGAFRSARADVEALLADPELAATVADTPMGRMSVEQHIDQVVSFDMPIHGWDLARATGQDEAMDAEDVNQLLSAMQALDEEMVEKMRIPGAFGPGVVVFGPEVNVAEGAGPQDRLLGFLGRDPSP